GDGLGHRKQAEDRLVRDRRLGGDVLHAEGFMIDRFAVLLDQEDRTSDLARRHFVAEELADPCQPVLIEICAGWKIERAFARADGGAASVNSAPQARACRYRPEFIGPPEFVAGSVA